MTLFLSQKNISSWAQVTHAIENAGLEVPLTHLYLIGNRITGWADCRLPDSLTYLDLRGNQITGWAGCVLPESLTYLYLSSNQIADWTNCRLPESLVHLNLDYNQITGWVDCVLPESLTRLYLHGNRITKKGIPSIFQYRIISKAIQTYMFIKFTRKWRSITKARQFARLINMSYDSVVYSDIYTELMQML